MHKFVRDNWGRRRTVGNIRCGGNDLPFGSYTAEWNSLGGD